MSLTDSPRREGLLYTALFLLIFALSILPVWGAILGYCTLFFMPMGLRSFSLACLTALLAGLLTLHSPRRTLILKRLRQTVLLWLPFILYLLLRSEGHPMGLWKWAAFVMRVWFPCLVLVVMYVHQPGLFRRWFIPVFLGINILLAVAAPLVPDEEQLYDVSIWVSRGLAMAIFFILALKRPRSPVLAGVLVLFFAGIMLFVGSRGPVIALILTLVIWAMRTARQRIIVVPALCYALVLVLILTVTVAPLKATVASFLTHDHHNHMQLEDFADDRLAMFGFTIEVFTDHPLLGAGLGNWGIGVIETFISDQALATFDIRAHWTRDNYYWPHNLFLELLGELGILGLLLYLLLFCPPRIFLDRHLFTNYLVLMGLLFACTSSDLAGNPAPLLFATMSRLISSPHPEEST